MQTTDKFDVNLEFMGRQLQDADPVSLLVNEMQTRVRVDDKNIKGLYVVLTELYVNALDHGILKLSSELKNSASGCMHYFNEREKRLKNISEGYIRLSLNVKTHKQGGCIIVKVEDSGAGFDYQSIINNMSDNEAYCGRGIKLVYELCRSLLYQTPGNTVQAVYCWDN